MATVQKENAERLERERKAQEEAQKKREQARREKIEKKVGGVVQYLTRRARCEVLTACCLLLSMHLMPCVKLSAQGGNGATRAREGRSGAPGT